MYEYIQLDNERNLLAIIGRYIETVKMVRITEELVRKRAEHNNYEISSLEEISLHQQDLERLEHLDKWCKELKILYLQSNLIPRIENVGRLKKLEYLNLALNNITKIENLAGCESLNKLDLTVNFVDELTSIESLRDNKFLKELFLTGNPCTQYEGYREYVIATLPQLHQLDGKEIDKSERIQATQNYSALRDSILQQQKIFKSKMEKKKDIEDNQKGPGFDGRWYTSIGNEEKKVTDKTVESEEGNLPDDEKERRYWSQPSNFTPESRVEMHKHIQEQQEKRLESKDGYFNDHREKREVRFFRENGEPLNVNTAKIEFMLNDDYENGIYVIDIACYKHLNTSLIDVDVQPHYVRVKIKDNFLQLVLTDEVSPDRATAQRSQTSGHLVISIPKAKQTIIKAQIQKKLKEKDRQNESKVESSLQEIKNDPLSLSDLLNIVKEPKVTSDKEHKSTDSGNELHESFFDDPDVPPLI